MRVVPNVCAKSIMPLFSARPSGYPRLQERLRQAGTSEDISGEMSQARYGAMFVLVDAPVRPRQPYAEPVGSLRQSDATIAIRPLFRR